MFSSRPHIIMETSKVIAMNLGIEPGQSACFWAKLANSASCVTHFVDRIYTPNLLTERTTKIWVTNWVWSASRRTHLQKMLETGRPPLSKNCRLSKWKVMILFLVMCNLHDLSKPKQSWDGLTLNYQLFVLFCRTNPDEFAFGCGKQPNKTLRGILFLLQSECNATIAKAALYWQGDQVRPVQWRGRFFHRRSLKSLSCKFALAKQVRFVSVKANTRTRKGGIGTFFPMEHQIVASF